MLKFKDIEQLREFITENVLDTAEAAELLGCSRQRIGALVNEGKLTPLKQFGNNRLFLRADIEERIKNLKAKKQPAE